MIPESKICGITRAQDMAAALEHGASMVGLVFFETSPRHVDFQHAALLAEHARGRARSVAVTVNASDDLLDHIVKTVKPDMLQLHGEEDTRRCAALVLRYGLPLIKSIGIAAAGDVAQIAAYKDVAAYCLTERRYPQGEMPGGRGLSFDWSLLSTPRAATPRLILSGGLHSGNVVEAICRTRADAADTSSGVEDAPGLKSAEKISAFITAVHSVNTGMFQRSSS